MRYTPLNTQEINSIAGRYLPDSVKSFNNLTYAYWERSLLQRIISRLDVTVPDNWEGAPKDFLLYCLIRIGYVLVSKNDALGFYFNPCSLVGQDFYYQPTRAIIANPRASEVGVPSEYMLHTDAELLKLMPDYIGFNDVISYYAEKLSTLDVAINTSIINSKLATVVAGKNKAAVESLKKVIDKINRGEPAVFTDKPLMNPQNQQDESPWQLLEIQKLKDNYILDKLLVDFQTIINSFDAEIGITTVPYQKAERLVSAEANSKIDDSQARIITAVECMKSSIKDIKKLYPDIQLNVELRKEETNVNSENNINRNAQL